MTPLENTISFDTKNGVVKIFSNDLGWFFEFVSGEHNGLHNDTEFKTFDKAYMVAKKKGSEKVD